MYLSASAMSITNAHILGGATVSLGVLYKIFTSWSSPLGAAALNAFHLGTFALNFGTQHWVSFVAGPTMIMTLPRHQFGKVQSKLFPKYFHLQTLTSASCLMAFLIKHPLESMETAQLIQVCALGSNLCMSLLNLLVFGPKSTQTLLKRHELEVKAGVGHEIGFHVDRTELLKDPEYAALNKQFGRLHAASMISNFCVMGGSYIHLLSLASNGL